MKPELKPCPFCGGAARLRDDRNVQSIYCLGCTATVKQPINLKTSVVDKWNRRAQPAEMASVTERWQDGEDSNMVSRIEPTEPVWIPSDDQLRNIWRDAGGRFHGPNIETGTIPEAQLLPFLRGFITGQATAGPVKVVSFDAWFAQRNSGLSFDQLNVIEGAVIEDVMIELSRQIRDYVTEMVQQEKL